MTSKPLPKYFDRLHDCISGITGTPRIVNIDFKKSNMSDKYKDIPKDEWESALLGYFAHFKDDQIQLMVGQNWEFFIGGNTTSKESLIKALEERIEAIKKLED